jgi:hypothetical protein
MLLSLVRRPIAYKKASPFVAQGINLGQAGHTQNEYS